MVLHPASTDDEEFSLETREASPAQLLTTVESFPMLMEHGIKILESSEFEAGDYKWHIEMHPNGDRRASGSYVSIFLYCVDAKSFPHGKKVNATCLFTFKNKLNHLKDHSMKVIVWFTSTNSGWGFLEFKAIDDMRDPSKGLVIKDCCILEIQLSVLAVQES